MKAILLILDGLGDRPIEELQGRTPLEAAEKPNLNKLAAQGVTGLLDPIGVGVKPGSDVAHLAIFGYAPAKYYPGRGPIEAIGLGIKLGQGDLALRANLASVNKKLEVIDRRAGRIEGGRVFEDSLRMRLKGIEFNFYAGIAHRGVVVLRGKNLSPQVSDCDPRRIGVKPLEVKPLIDSREAKNTAKLLNAYLSKAHSVLEKHSMNKAREKHGLPPVNFLLLRGAGARVQLPSFNELYGLNAAFISPPGSGGLPKGVARLTEMDVIEVRKATGFADTDLKEKFLSAKKALENHDFVFVHVKALDLFSHDGNYVGKKEFIERIDSFIPVLEPKNALLALTGDHSTPCALKDHSGDPVPILISGPGVRTDQVQEFGERSCAQGGLGRIKGVELMPELLNLMNKSRICGA